MNGPFDNLVEESFFEALSNLTDEEKQQLKQNVLNKFPPHSGEKMYFKMVDGKIVKS